MEVVIKVKLRLRGSNYCKKNITNQASTKDQREIHMQGKIQRSTILVVDEFLLADCKTTGNKLLDKKEDRR